MLLDFFRNNNDGSTFFKLSIGQKEQRAILQYKPGIVDPATLRFSKVENELLAQSKDIEKDYIEKILPEKINLSLEYAQKATFLSDIKCLFKCFIHIIK